MLGKNQTISEEDLGKYDTVNYNIMENDFITTEDEELYETSLLFDPNKNLYYNDINNSDNYNNHNIQQLLETELLSDDKSEFSISFNNSQLMNYISNSTIDIEYLKKKDATSESEDKIKEHINGENMKLITEELEKIKTELLKLNEMTENTKSKKKPDIYQNNKFNIEVIVYFSRQFEALRVTYCCSYEEILLSVNFIIN